jgi:hypothetical protein
VASTELFDSPPGRARHPPRGVTARDGGPDFTVPTFRRWVRTDAGLEASLYPLKAHGYLGSGTWEAVVREGGLHGESQFEAVRAWAKAVG